MGLVKYLKKAFVNHWNLLAFLGGMGFAALSGQPDVAIPVVLAAEAAYLGYMAGNPRFQHHVDSQDAKTARQIGADQAFDRLLKALPPAQIRRFEALRDRCLSLRHIAQQLRETQGVDTIRTLEDAQLSDLDNLLWIYLRMLYTQHMLDRFLETTDERRIQAEIDRLEERISQTPHDPTSLAAQRILPALRENLETSKARLANIQKAREESRAA